MIQIIPSEKRYKAAHGWLVTYHSFSFAEYYDPNNIQFGALRVFNDDTVQPGRGFGEHPHADMEIMTYVIDGTLEHRDSLGNRGLLRAGEVQRMTAGTGIFHSEYNASDEKPVHFLQIWFLPDQKGLTPSWEQKAFPPRPEAESAPARRLGAADRRGPAHPPGRHRLSLPARGGATNSPPPGSGAANVPLCHRRSRGRRR